MRRRARRWRAPTRSRRLLFGVGADGEDRELLDLGYVAFGVWLAIDRFHLLDDRRGRQDFAEEFFVYVGEVGRLGEFVEIDDGRDRLIVLHVGFFEIVELIAHALARLIWNVLDEHAEVGTGNEAAFGRAEKRITSED